MSILLSEGSSTSARHVLYALGRQGHTIDVCDPQRLCLGWFSRYVRNWERCPSYTADPIGYIQFLVERLTQEKYDVLFPVHDQVYLLARFRETLCQFAGLAVPEFAAVAQTQDKVTFARLMETVGLPHPQTTVVQGIERLDQPWEFPCYLKLPVSTAGCGVWCVRSAGEVRAVMQTLRRLPGNTRDSEFLIQQEAEGTFHVVQCVFAHGKLMAAHCYKGTATGVGGSAHGRESVSHPFVFADVARLGAHLSWHGAMHMEYFYDHKSGIPTYIEANPRIGETLNATLSGTNLCELLARVSLGQSTSQPTTARAGVRTHSVLMGLMGKAERGGGRLSLLRELFRAWTGKGAYRDSEDELTRPREDGLSVIPAAAVTLQLLCFPSLARRMIRRTVDNYSLNSAAAERIRALPEELLPAAGEPSPAAATVNTGSQGNEG